MGRIPAPPTRVPADFQHMTPRQERCEPAPQGAVPARVVAVDGTWACLWIPETGQTTWVDLAQVEHEPLQGLSTVRASATLPAWSPRDCSRS
jgi:hypothetical protein